MSIEKENINEKYLEDMNRIFEGNLPRLYWYDLKKGANADPQHGSRFGVMDYEAHRVSKGDISKLFQSISELTVGEAKLASMYIKIGRFSSPIRNRSWQSTVRKEEPWELVDYVHVFEMEDTLGNKMPLEDYSILRITDANGNVRVECSKKYLEEDSEVTSLTDDSVTSHIADIVTKYSES